MGGEVARVRTRAGIFACCSFALAMLAAPASAESAPALEMLWRARMDGGLEWRVFDDAGKPGVSERIPGTHTGKAADGPFAPRVPLGSLWKLFVYLWLVEQRHPAPDYVCTEAHGKQGNSATVRKRREEETYCCEPGQRIGRELALVRSCGLFFEPQRLGISSEAWRTFWEARPGVRDAAPWLADLGAMKPETVVSPASILHALEAAPTRAWEEAASTLLARLFAASSPGLEAAELIRGMGGRLRVKTFSWHRPGQPTKRYGGGAGWLIDGRPVWFASEGTGQQVIARHGVRLAETLTETLPPDGGSITPGCVRVNFFARYPFELEQQGGKSAREGVLQGRVVARVQSGVSIPVTACGALALSRPHGRARGDGRFGG
ncbi:MAG: DUF2300 domain-containing protein, partial [Azoarcus sp.]|nr:DUF2300 domain-containing protein [Azoarcus sp.]